MKNLFFFFTVFLISLTVKSQDEIDADLLLTPIKKQTVKFVSCRPTIAKHALFIVDGVPILANDNGDFLEGISPEDVVSISVLKGASAVDYYGSLAVNGVVLISTSKIAPVFKPKKYAFKSYKIFNDNWNISQDVYNDIQAIVPNVTITTSADLNAIPNIRMRGDDNTIVIVDGIRYDASILNTLNPSNIESITVAPSVAASNYLRNN